MPTEPAPASDSCATAQELVFTEGVASVSGSTYYADNSNVGAPNQSPHCDPLAVYRQDVVYRFTLTDTQDVLIDVHGASADGIRLQGGTSVAVQRTCGAPGPGDELDCQTGPSASTGVHFTRHSMAAGTYFLWIEAGCATLRARARRWRPGIRRTPTTSTCARSPRLRRSLLLRSAAQLQRSRRTYLAAREGMAPRPRPGLISCTRSSHRRSGR